MVMVLSLGQSPMIDPGDMNEHARLFLSRIASGTSKGKLMEAVKFA